MHRHPPSCGAPLLELVERHHGDAAAVASVTLPFESRQRSRLRVTLDDGREAALILPRGEVLRGGDRLRSRCGAVVAVVAAPEPLSQVRASEAGVLARAAYHLGNRHVAVQVGQGWLRYRHDHVLDDMLRGLGLDVGAVSAAFEPEAGAYSAPHAHASGHDHDHDHAHDAGHDH
jgi:urease accessory protein